MKHPVSARWTRRLPKPPVKQNQNNVSARCNRGYYHPAGHSYVTGVVTQVSVCSGLALTQVAGCLHLCDYVLAEQLVHLLDVLDVRTS